MMRLPNPTHFEWDEGNIDKNWVKHRVSNKEAEACFFDKGKRILEDVIHSTEGEQRYILFGRTRKARLLFIVFTIRQNKVRIISARPVNQKERPIYEEAD